MLLRRLFTFHWVDFSRSTHPTAEAAFFGPKFPDRSSSWNEQLLVSDILYYCSISVLGLGHRSLGQVAQKQFFQAVFREGF